MDKEESEQVKSTQRTLHAVRQETALIEQHERNEARSFHRWLTQTRPEDPIVKQMERDHPVLLEPEERHAKRACPACRERA